MSLFDYSQLVVKPKLIGFDLDGTIWTPDMYMLESGSPFSVIGDGSCEIRGARGEKVKLMGSSGHILHDLKNDNHWKECKISWVSRCDEPTWAVECLQKFVSKGLEPLETIAHSSHIYGGDKKQHFRALQKEYPHIPFEDMIFFDNEMSNLRSVKQLGVFCVYCPNGMTQQIWEDSLLRYSESKSKMK